MKIQCNCGEKYAFDVSPEMANNPVSFVCPKCGLDSSAVVNELVRQELGVASAPPSAQNDAPAPQAEASICLKHSPQQFVDTCRVCGKPICPKCMELFGYVCSPLCRTRATSRGIEIPVYAGQKSVVAARQWRKISWMAGGIAGVIVLVLGLWGWYAWFGCTPGVVLSVRFPEASYSGDSVFADKEHNQLVFIHGHQLARHDLKTKNQVWSRELLDMKAISAKVRQDLKKMAERFVKMGDDGYTGSTRTPSPQEYQRDKERETAAELLLRVRGQNIWVVGPESVRLFDWNTGKTTKEFPVSSGRVFSKGDDAFIMDLQDDPPKVTRINLCSAESEEVLLPGLHRPTPRKINPPANQAALARFSTLAAAFQKASGNGPLDPSDAAAEVGALPYQAQLALPALLAAKLNQDRLTAELDGLTPRPPPTAQHESPTAIPPMVIPTGEGALALTVTLIESKIVERVAMKAPPAKSALNENVRASQSLEIANEMLNEMQRDRGADKVREDLSTYEVTIKAMGKDDSWTSKVTGPPRLIPLKTVNVLVSGKSILILDKSLKKLWQSTLNYDVPPNFGAFGLEDAEGIENTGPCIERKDTLYVFDLGVLSAFDLKTGHARWRLPTVGIESVYFDSKDMLYVNTTTASHERIKYSRQIDVANVPGAIIMKVNLTNGKVLWRNGTVGWVSQIVGSYIFAVSSYTVPEKVEALRGTSFETGFEKQAYLRIRRIDPKKGKTIWEHYEARAPLDIQFEDNFIRLVFRKEVEVLKFMRL